ncbi:MAG: isomerase [Candidatus Pacearchaeota archaeon]|nr:isomerase [Candidatus Pacearchaeota archaeon]
MEWIFDIFEENYLKLLNSKKEVEGRVPDPSKERKQYNKIVRGDKIVIRVVDEKFQPVNTIKPLEFIASYNKKYDSVKEMLESEGLERVLPEANSIEEGIKLYHNLPGYEERIKINGIHAIGLENKI